MKQLIMIDIEDAGKTILDFIGTDDYKRILDSIDNSKSGGFMAGLSIAYSLLMTRCNRFTYNMPEPKDIQPVPEDDHCPEPINAEEDGDDA